MSRTDQEPVCPVGHTTSSAVFLLNPTDLKTQFTWLSTLVNQTLRAGMGTSTPGPEDHPRGRHTSRTPVARTCMGPTARDREKSERAVANRTLRQSTPHTSDPWEEPGGHHRASCSDLTQERSSGGARGFHGHRPNPLHWSGPGCVTSALRTPAPVRVLNSVPRSEFYLPGKSEYLDTI